VSEYPEHDKLAAVRDQSQAIGQFLDLGPYRLCEFDEYSGEFLAVGRSIPEVLADWFDIDLDRLEREKRAMLARLRSLNEPVPARPVARPLQWPTDWSRTETR
jgi:hypothetical protein